ncbi:MAG: PaaX family transcriptional regulator C-terminal domain-containing protein [Pseudomonas sp.]|uniref:PaaX family transcriptional regulator C-terminal domain-containing protein n=1 Tax=Pseudomonas sp. TaxID=306 RepID=UPI0033922253
MKLTAKTLILDLLLASDGRPLSARDAIVAAALFGISENTVRVALARLSTDSLLEGAGRGCYHLGPLARELAGDVASWRTAEQRMRPWSGDYLAVVSAALGRSDRTALRRRERALQLLGFRELEKGLHVRPNNIESNVEAVRRRLYGLGLEASARMFVAGQFEAASVTQIHALWDGAALNGAYHQLSQQLEAWLLRAGELEPEVAARESFLLGSRAIRQVVHDPLLPAPLVDTEARQAFVACVRRFDQAGQQIWQALHRGPHTALPAVSLNPVHH